MFQGAPKDGAALAVSEGTSGEGMLLRVYDGICDGAAYCGKERGKCREEREAVKRLGFKMVASGTGRYPTIKERRLCFKIL